MDVLQKQKFEGDLCLSPTALFYANLHGDIFLTLEEAAVHLKMVPGTIHNKFSDKDDHDFDEAGFFQNDAGRWLIHVQDLADHMERMRARKRIKEVKKRGPGAPKKVERMIASGG